MDVLVWLGQNVGAATEVFMGLTVLVFAYGQWRISRREERLERDRQRDAQMAVWAGRVIDMMAELEVACYPLDQGGAVDPERFNKLDARASALLDRGRLFFPNVRAKGDNADEGTRIKLLDDVLKACYVARHIAAFGNDNPSKMRNLVWQARRRFVKLIEQEIEKSLRPVKEESKGQSVPMDPWLWIETKELRLPDRP